MRKARFGAVSLIALGLLAGPALGGGNPAGDAVDRFFDAYRNGSLEGLLSIYSADAVFEDVNQRHRFEGTEQLGAFLGALIAAHHEMDLREKRRLVDDKTVVVEYEYVGKLNGAVVGASAGKTDCPDLEYVLPATSWYEVDGGKIVHQRDFIDLATYRDLQQRMLAAGTEE